MAKPIDPELLKILCCPETHQPLTEAPGDLVARINTRIAAGTLKNRAAQPVTEPVAGGLLRQDGKVLYPIRNDIPVLLIDEGLPLD
jgi:uncharacterized protein YbaR (Trm112 family)